MQVNGVKGVKRRPGSVNCSAAKSDAVRSLLAVAGGEVGGKAAAGRVWVMVGVTHRLGAVLGRVDQDGRPVLGLGHLAVDETVIFADALSPSLLIHLLKVEGGATK